MNLLVLGATGPTGRHIVDLARRPEALEDLADQVTVAVGDATSHHHVAKAMVGQDVVLSALGRSTSVRADDLFTRASKAVLGAAKEMRGRRRLHVQGGP